MQSSHTDRRVPELDAIRGLAALAILVTHLPRGFWLGEHGVDLFFVLSGYLITAIILGNNHRPAFYRTFMVRRALRIWPIYYLCIVGLLVINQLRNTRGSLDGLPYYLLYLQNVPSYWGAQTPDCLFSLGHTWTLAIEEQFYIFWPLFLLVTGRRGVLPLSLGLIVLPLILRFQGIDRVTLLGHSEGFGWGGVLCVLLSNRGAALPSQRLWCGFAFVAVVAAAGVGYYLRADALLVAGSTGKQVIGDNIAISLVNLVCFGIVGLAILLNGSRWLGILRFRPLVYLGMISYGLYLYHWIIYELLDTYLKFGRRLGDPYWLDVLKVITSLIAAVLSWHLIELPILRLKNRFSYSDPNASPGHCMAVVAPLPVMQVTVEQLDLLPTSGGSFSEGN